MEQQRGFLIQTSSNSTSYCKFLLFTTFAVSSLVISAVFLLTKPPTTHHFLSSFCYAALSPESCRDYASEVVSDGPPDGTKLLQSVLLQNAARLEAAIAQTRKLKIRINGQDESGPVGDCLELLDRSLELVRDSASAVSASSHVDARAWLSAVLTNHVTCRDGLSNNTSLSLILQDLISRARASLAILSAVSSPDGEMIQISRPSYKLPSWITAADRKLLQSSGSDIKADLTVAKDGSGNYKTVAEAIAAAPDKSMKRYVIRVKKGTYKENVEVGKNKKNLMIVGDGMDSTIITGNLNVVDGSTTFKSATLAAVGDGFILQDICIQNTAGPEKHQAVALRVGADKSVINRCRIEAYQDTLYAHSLRQFYRDCTVSGTVDFIFGDAAVVLQKCKLEARKPMKGQKNMVTAQGRVDPNQNTGTSIQDCEIRASADLDPVKASFPTYLGRPWKEYSRTVVMQSYIGDHVDPAGWSEWSGDFALKTLYYGEYMNRGPGAGTGNRVTWPGYHVITDAAEARKFTVKEMIQGGDWLASTGVAYTEGL